MSLIKVDYGEVGGGATLKFTCQPCRPKDQANRYDDAYVALETEYIKHFKSTFNSSLSTYTDDSTYYVGYADTIPSGYAGFNGATLSNEVSLSSADFDVVKTYKYLVIHCRDSSLGRIFDIELTLV